MRGYALTSENPYSPVKRSCNGPLVVEAVGALAGLAALGRRRLLRTGSTLSSFHSAPFSRSRVSSSEKKSGNNAKSSSSPSGEGRPIVRMSDDLEAKVTFSGFVEYRHRQYGTALAQALFRLAIPAVAVLAGTSIVAESEISVDISRSHFRIWPKGSPPASSRLTDPKPEVEFPLYFDSSSIPPPSP